MVVERGDGTARKAETKAPERGRSIKTLSQVANVIFDDIGIQQTVEPLSLLIVRLADQRAVEIDLGVEKGVHVLGHRGLD